MNRSSLDRSTLLSGRLPLSSWLPLLILLGGVLWLGVMAHHDDKVDQRALARLNNLLKADHQVDKEVLRLRYGLRRTYDPLLAELDYIGHQVSRLKAEAALRHADMGQEYLQSLQALQSAYRGKLALSEDFSSDNALLRNSTLYLPDAVTDFESSLSDTPADQALRATLLRLSQALLAPSMPHAELPRVAESLATELGRVSTEAPGRDNLQRLLQHTELIMRYAPAVDEQLQQLLASPLQASIRDSRAALQALTSKVAEKRKTYNLMLLLVSAVLVLYLAVLFRRLQRAATELSGSNSELEQQVQQRARAQAVLGSQNEILDAMVHKQPLPEVLRQLCLNMEKLAPESMASVMLADKRGEFLGNGVAPSLPHEYASALTSLPIQADRGSCGTAAHCKQPVYASDIANDPRWQAFEQLARENNIHACWSTPFFSGSGQVLGTFALSYHQTKSPTEDEKALLHTAADLATIAVEAHYADQSLIASRERFRHIFENVPVSLWEQDYSVVKQLLDELRTQGVSDFPHWLQQHPDRVEHMRDQIGMHRVNAATLKMFRADDLKTLATNRVKLLTDGSMDSIRDRIAAMAEGKEFYQGESRYRTLAGDEITVMINIAFPVESGDFSRVLVSVLDITPLKQAEIELEEAKDRAETTLNSITDGVFTTDVDGLITSLNPTAQKLVGWPGSEALGQPLTDVLNLVDQWTHQPLLAPVEQSLHEQRVIELDDHIVLLDRSGRDASVEISAAPLRCKRAQAQGNVVVVRDVTETRRLARDLVHQASHDPLTGLINRREFEERLKVALAAAHSDQRVHALCFLDLDQFKIVNDTCGHVAGDELLKRLSHRLRTKIRGRDTLGRLGGDEFAVLLEDCPLERAEEIAEDLRDSVREFRFSWEGRKFELGVSIGLTAITDRAESTARLLSEADVACYTAKDLGRNRVHLFQPEDQETEQRYRELQWAADITNALEQNRFQLFCQRLQPLTGSDINPHYEVLLRLRDVEGNEVMPGAFIPAAERFNLMQSIDRWTITSTFAWYAKHRTLVTRSGVNLAINLSGNSLSREGLVPFILEQQREHRIPAERFCFEVTETAAIGNLALAAEFIRQLKEHGFLFALDDFGTGLSSFAYLKNLPVDYLKIDGAFVRDMLTDPADEAMVRAINQIGHTMGKKTIAEWAESDAIVSRLQDLGVDYAQGYAVGRPCPIDGLLVELAIGRRK